MDHDFANLRSLSENPVALDSFWNLNVPFKLSKKRIKVHRLWVWYLPLKCPSGWMDAANNTKKFEKNSLHRFPFVSSHTLVAAIHFSARQPTHRLWGETNSTHKLKVKVGGQKNTCPFKVKVNHCACVHTLSNLRFGWKKATEFCTCTNWINCLVWYMRIYKTWLDVYYTVSIVNENN